MECYADRQDRRSASRAATSTMPSSEEEEGRRTSRGHLRSPASDVWHLNGQPELEKNPGCTQRD